MKVKILEKKENKLLRRLEVVFEVQHEDGEGTPPRNKVREEIAKKLKREIDVVFLKKLITKAGLNVSVGRANIYESADSARAIEPEYIIMRSTAEKGEET